MRIYPLSSLSIAMIVMPIDCDCYYYQNSDDSFTEFISKC